MPYIDNPNFNDQEEDNLYHFGFTTKTYNFVDVFGDVKFVCCGGSAKRMEKMAHSLGRELSLPSSDPVVNYSRTDRYALFKAGPVLCVNHGIGTPSLHVMLHELFKLLHHAKCTDVLMFRMGTSGGIGVEPGTLVIADEAYNGLLEPVFTTECLGKAKSYPTTLDPVLCDELCAQAASMNIPVVKGKTACSCDFYEGQGRLDGAFCPYTKEEKMAFLKKAHDLGIRNFEMEATGFAALTKKAGIRAGLICVTLLNRLERDQVPTTLTGTNYDELPCQLVTAYIKKRLLQAKHHQNGIKL